MCIVVPGTHIIMAFVHRQRQDQIFVILREDVLYQNQCPTNPFLDQ
jgi:hypothetical protein